MDLVARKMMDGGEAAYALMHEVLLYADGCKKVLPDLAGAVFSALETLRETTEWLVEQDMQARFAGAVPYLRLFARVLGGYYHLCAAHSAGADSARAKLAQVYIMRLLPEHIGLAQQARLGSDDLYAFSEDDLAA